MSITNNKQHKKPAANISDLINGEKKARFNAYIPELMLKELKHAAIEDSQSMTDIDTAVFQDYLSKRKCVRG
ncbi:MAG: hypothetical protein HOM14_15635 [Gammaproteobacteria bacterium]|jgi:hypothetical protein|nr:hypothetical protein [Gammaproteobacteria bacterium]MBT6552779.1 hypothetical protein [Gammaproteobacteria bacterium]